MSSRLNSILLVLLAMKGVQAQTPPAKQGQPIAEEKISAKKELLSHFDKQGWKQPDHLVPIDPCYDYPVIRRYDELWNRLLQVPDRGKLVMVYRPSFEPEECLVIHEIEGEKPQYTLIHTYANRSIWYAMPENRDEDERKEVAKVEVMRHEAPFPPDLARRVGKLWEKMLAAVRYPEPEYARSGIEDATVIEFRYCREYGRPMYGEARSPSQGAPKLLLDLGRSLIDYASANEAGRASMRTMVEEKCQALEDHFAEKSGN